MATPRQLEYADDFVMCLEHSKENLNKNTPKWAIRHNIIYARRCYDKIKDVKEIIVSSALKDLNELEKSIGWEVTQ